MNPECQNQSSWVHTALVREERWAQLLNCFPMIRVLFGLKLPLLSKCTWFAWAKIRQLCHLLIIYILIWRSEALKFCMTTGTFDPAKNLQIQTLLVFLYVL